MIRHWILLALFIWTSGLAPRAALAEGWSPAHERQTSFVGLANKAGLPMAGEAAVKALQRAYDLPLTRERVRVVSFSGERKFWTFVEQAKGCALGTAVTPHSEGPHPHLLTGDQVYDGIQPGWRRSDGSRATFLDGTMMRRDSFGQVHQGSSRIFCLFKAPASSVARVQRSAEKLYTTKRERGINCALLVTQELAREGHDVPGSPFAAMVEEVFPKHAVKSVIKARPDLILQVVPDHQLDQLLQTPDHLIKFWHDQRL